MYGKAPLTFLAKEESPDLELGLCILKIYIYHWNSGTTKKKEKEML